MKPGELVTLGKDVSRNLWRQPDHGGSDGTLVEVNHDEVLLLIAIVPAWEIPMALLYSPRFQLLGWKRSDYLQRA